MGPVIDGEVFGGGDLQVEWDSDPDPNDRAEGERAMIDVDFAGVGATVTATVAGIADGVDATCVEK